MIEGTKIFEYRVYGVVPPGVPDATVEGVVFSSVSWCQTILPHLRGAAVLVHDTIPEDLKKAMELTGPRIVS